MQRILVGIAGATVLVVGIAMILLPGPAILLIPLGLAILASEFALARWLLKKGREELEDISADHPKSFSWLKKLLNKAHKMMERGGDDSRH
jgi:urea transporter